MKVEDAIVELVVRGLLDWNDAHEESEYLDTARCQNRLRKLLEKGRDYYQAQNTTIRGILETYNCSFTPGLAKTAAAYHVALNPDMLDELEIDVPKESKGTLRWWGHYSVIAIPAYVEWRLMGFWLIKPRISDGKRMGQEWDFLILDSYVSGRPTGYGTAVGIEHSHAFIVDHPIVAMRMLMRQLADGEIVAPAVIPRGRLNPFHLGATKPVFFPTTESTRERVYHEATAVLGADSVWFDRLVVASPDSLGFNPLTQFGPSSARTTQAVVRNLLRKAMPAHQAMGNLLIKLDPNKARKVVSSYPMTMAHQNQILSYFSGDDHAELALLFESDPRSRTIDIDGKLVTERPEGWYHGNKLVSDVTFTVEGVETDAIADTRVARGLVTFDRMSYRYEEDYDLIRKNVGKWLEDTVLRHSGRGIPVITGAWRKHLLRIAMAFHAPERATPTSRYGWQEDGHTLCLPCFSLTADTISMTETNISGPRLGAPVNIRAEEWAAWEDPEFCQVGLALIMNLLQTQRGLPGRGLIFTRGQHIIEKLASGLRAEIATNPSMDNVLAASRHPLPLMVSWSPDAMSDFLRRKSKEPAHVAVSVPRSTARLLKIHGGWMVLDILDLPDEGSLRTVFPLVQDLLKHGVDITADEPLHGLVALLAAFFVERGINPYGLTEAKQQIGSNAYAHPGNIATLVLAQMWWAVREKKLRYREELDILIFEVRALKRVFSTPGAPPLDMSYLASVLTRSNMLMDNADGHWAISKDMWNTYGSFLPLVVQ